VLATHHRRRSGGFIIVGERQIPGERHVGESVRAAPVIRRSRSFSGSTPPASKAGPAAFYAAIFIPQQRASGRFFFRCGRQLDVDLRDLAGGRRERRRVHRQHRRRFDVRRGRFHVDARCLLVVRHRNHPGCLRYAALGRDAIHGGQLGGMHALPLL